MMKELKAVRDWKDAAGVDSRLFLREVNALVKAVREDAAKVAENTPYKLCDGCAKHLAAAIRRK